MEVEIKPLLTESTFTPEDALDNIIGAKALGITPDSYAEDKVRLKPDVEAAKLPTYSPPIMAEKMDSRSIASIIKPDFEKLSYAERQMGYFSDNLKKGDLSRRRNAQAIDIMLNGENEDNSIEFVTLNGQIKDIEESQKKYNLGFAETIPSEVANVGVDQYRMIKGEFKTVAAIGAVSAAAGGTLGFLGGLGVPLPGGAPTGAAAGALGGLIASLRYGPKAALYKDSVSQSAGELYAELTAPSEDGRPALTREQAIPFAFGGGAVIGSLDLVGADLLLKKVPFLKKFLKPREFAKEIMKAENKAIREGFQALGSTTWIKDILKGAASEGVTEGVQEYVGAAVKETARSDKNGVQALTGGIWDAITNVDNLISAAKATAIGGVAGGSFVAVGKGVNSVISEKKGSVEAPVVQDQAPLADTLGLNNNLPKSITEESYKAYHVAQAVAEQALLRQDTKFKELTPEEHNQLLNRQAELNGVPSLYADPEALTEFANSEEKAAAVQAAMDNSGTLEAGQNVPVRFDTEKAIELQMKYPEFAQVLKDSPEGISVNEYKKILEERQKAANEILQKNQDAAQAQVQEQAGDTDSVSQAEELLTQQEIAPRQLTPDQQTLVDARTDLYLNDIKNKNLNDKQLADMVVTRERAQYVIDETQAEIDDIKAGSDIEIMASASTNEQLESMVKAAKPGKAKIKDGRTVEFIPSVQENGVPIVVAKIDGKLAGSVRMHLERQHGKNVTTPAMTQVEKEFRRKGVATAMYEYIRENVVRLEHSNIQLPDGKAFAQGSRKKGTGVFKTPNTEKLDAIKKRLMDLQPLLPSYNDGRLRDADIHTEQQYLNQSIFTKPIEGVLSQSEVDKLTNDVKNARLENIERIDESLEKEWTDVTDFQTEISLQAEREAQAQLVENNPEIQIVENFLNDKIIGVPDENMLARKANGKPMIQVDPRLLPEKFKKFIDDPVLKARKFFNKGGMSLNQAMNYFDVASPEDFLRIMSEVPDREGAIKKALELREGPVREDVQNATPLDEASRMKYYDNTAKLHMEELKTLKDKSWPSLKNAIKRIALPLPKIEEIATRARQAVAATPVKLLNAKRYVIGEGKAQKKAVTDVLKGAFESAFANKQAALLNNVLAKESQRMIKLVNQANRRLVDLLSETTREQLEEAGPDYAKGFDYILGTFNFDNTRKGIALEEDYQRFADRMIREGKADLKIPEGLAERLSGKLNARDLSAQDYLFLVGRLASIAKQARFKNVLSKQFKAAIGAEHTSAIEETAKLKAESHPNYDPNRSGIELPPDTMGDHVMAISSGFRRQMDNLLSITTYLDEGNHDGWWTRTFYDSLKGIGQFDDGVNGEKAAINWRAALQSRYLKSLKDYGLSKFKNMGNRALNITEWADNKYLKNGRLTKAELFTLATHMGNAENKSRILNFNITPESALQVLEKYLTTEDMDFIQANIWDEYENNIKPRLKAKEIDTHGVEPQWTVSESFTFKGKEYRGGHMPLKYATKGDGRAARQSARDLADAILGKKKLGVRDVRALDGIVFSPHTEERTGSNWLIDLDPMTIQQGFEDVIYDVSMRDPVKYAMEIVSDKAIAKEIQNVIGIKRYNNLVEMIAEATRSYNSYEIDLFKDSVSTMKNMADTIQQGHAVAAIGLSIPSLLIQAASMRFVLSNMGVKSGMKYIAESMMTWINPYMMQSKSWSEMMEFTNDIDPALKSFQEGMDTKNSNLIRKLSPNDRALKKSNVVSNFAYNKLKNIQQGMTDLWFEGAMASVDNTMKRIVALAAYRQYMDGNAPGQDLKKWAKMDDSQKQRAAKAYAQKINGKSLTSGGVIDRAMIQKTMPGILFSRYWNDGRNAINHNLQETSNLRNNMRKAVKAARIGDYKKFDEYFTDTGERVMRMFFLSTISVGFTSMVRGLRWEDEEKEPFLVPKEDEGALGYMGRLGYTYMHEMFLQNIPVVSSASFALERFANTGKVPTAQIPLTDALTKMTESAKILGHDYAYNLANGLTLTEVLEGTSDKDLKALGMTTSIVTGGVPVSGLFDIYKMFSDPDTEYPLKNIIALPALIAQLLGVSTDFIQNNDKEKDMTEDEMIEEVIRRAKEGKESSGIQGIVDEAKSLVAQGTSIDKEDLTEDEYHLFKIAESNGKWNARPKKFVKDPDTGKDVWEGEYLSGAFGYYQFLPSTWSDIVDMAPKSMGLTEGGLYNKKQQEKGARVWVKHIVSQFKKADVAIPVTTENIYGAHHFGVNGWIKVMEAKETKTIKSVLGEKVLEANPQIEKRGYKTIKDLKQYISDQLDIAKGKIET